jgi:DNA-binding NarL/FixJ family response regulator
MSTRETAQTLHLSVKTIESHRQRIKRKLNLHTGTQLVRFAVAGLFNPEESHDPDELFDP